MIKILLLTLLAASACPPAFAQDAVPPLPQAAVTLASGDATETEPSAADTDEEPIAATKPTKPRKDESPWSFRAALRNVFDSNIDQNEDETYSRGFVAEFGTKYKAKTPVGDLELDYEIGTHSYTNTEVWDRTTHDFEAILEHKLGGQWFAQTTGEVSIKDSSDDGDIRDVYLLEQRLEYRLTPVYRFRAEGALRQKKYDEDPRRDSQDPYYAVVLVQRHPNGWRWDTGHRYDRNRADDARFTYQRWTFDTAVSRDFGKRNAVALEARYRIRRYNERWISTPSGVERRKDRYWVLESRWDHILRKDLELRFDYVFETRRSNDSGNAFDDHLLATTLTQRW